MKQIISTFSYLVFVFLLFLIPGCTSQPISITVKNLPTSTTPTSTTLIISETPASSTINPTTEITSSTTAAPLSIEVSGGVMYTDGTIAGHAEIAIFAQGSYISAETTHTDSDGNYYFSGLPSGEYDIYAGGLYRNTLFIDEYDARIDINGQGTTIVGQLSIPKEINNICCNGVTLTNNGLDFTNTISFSSETQLSFSWDNVPNALSGNYDVEITSVQPIGITYDQDNTAYDTNNIAWGQWGALPLPQGKYRITITDHGTKN